tara:strand:+ start:1777 stop:2517 length:741 start_codon:yes stop_codon:yes gene_type:complete
MWGAILAGGIQGYFKGRDQDDINRAENERRRQEYKRALEVRKRKWQQSRDVYGAKKNAYNIELNEIHLAANRGYEKTRDALNNKRAKALATNEADFIKYVQKTLGKVAAAGMTGQSAGRIAGRIEAIQQFKQAQRLNSLIKSGEAGQAANEAIYRKAKASQRQAYAKVAFTPIPSLAPNPPQMLSESGGGLRGLLMGGLTSAISNWGSNNLNTGLEGKGMKYDGDLNSGDIWNMPSDYDPLAGFRE